MVINRVGLQVGNYRLLQVLGKGGFAEVYLGKHSYLQSYAALKVLQVSLSEKEAQRFQAEAQTLVRLPVGADSGVAVDRHFNPSR